MGSQPSNRLSKRHFIAGPRQSLSPTEAPKTRNGAQRCTAQGSPDITDSHRAHACAGLGVQGFGAQGFGVSGVAVGYSDPERSVIPSIVCLRQPYCRICIIV